MMAMIGTVGHVTEKEKLRCVQNVQESFTKDVLDFQILILSVNLFVQFVRLESILDLLGAKGHLQMTVLPVLVQDTGCMIFSMLLF